ncbi:Unknown protein, partial [Striga hermonthica]
KQVKEIESLQNKVSDGSNGSKRSLGGRKFHFRPDKMPTAAGKWGPGGLPENSAGKVAGRRKISPAAGKYRRRKFRIRVRMYLIAEVFHERALANFGWSIPGIVHRESSNLSMSRESDSSLLDVDNGVGRRHKGSTKQNRVLLPGVRDISNVEDYEIDRNDNRTNLTNTSLIIPFCSRKVRSANWRLIRVGLSPCKPN